MLVRAGLVLLCLGGATAACVVTPHVDRHLIRNAMDASLRPTLGWTLSPSCGSVAQTNVRVALNDATGKVIWSSRLLTTNLSSAVDWGTWMDGASFQYRSLTPGTTYSVQVAVTLADGQGQRDFSAPTAFHTQLTPEQYESSLPMWAANTSAKFVMFRREVAAAPHAQTYLSISAKPSPDWHLPHGRNSSHLLCAYKLWLGGVPLGVGPGRRVGGTIGVDTFNLTSLLASGPDSSVLAIEAFYASNPDTEGGQPDPDDRGGVVAILHDGSNQTVHGGASSWRVLDATPAFRPTLGPRGNGAGTGSYAQVHENIDARSYPHGWRSSDFDDSAWSAPITRLPFGSGMAAKEALPVALRSIPAAKFTVLSPPSSAASSSSSAEASSTDSDSGATYRYVIDYGRNFQGHVNVSFAAGVAGQLVTVRLGEQLLTNGSVKFHAESNNVWEDQWILSGKPGENFVPHEYAEFRWAEVIGAPEPPTHQTISGWQVHYPFDAVLNEEPAVTSERSPQKTTQKQPAEGLSVFGSSSKELDQVWELTRHTIAAAALDLNTDSNTRQRDLCTLDAWLATRYQAGVAPGTSAHLRRRVTRNMYEPNGFVNYWTEFLVAHVGALYEYTTEYGDVSLAARLWNQAGVDMGSKSPGPLGMANYSLSAYYDEQTAMVRHTPRPLVDWPRSPGIDTDSSTSTVCRELCVQMNAYAVLTQGWMGGITQRAGTLHGVDPRTPARYANRSAAIRAAAHSTFAASGSHCNLNGSSGDAPVPAPPPPPSAPPTAVATCVKRWEKDTKMHHHGSNGIATLNCGPGKTIADVTFADYGTASGDCQRHSFTADPECSAGARAKAVLEAVCLHKQWCRVQASDEEFGDACSGTAKYLSAVVTCSSPADDAPTFAADLSKSADAATTTDFNCYTDKPAASPDSGGGVAAPAPGTTSVTATSLAAFARLPGSAAGVLKLVPFIAARNSRRGPEHGLEGSGWMTGFMMEGVYSAAGEVAEGSLSLAAVSAAAEYCYETLTNAGGNSWLGMIAQNATMTMESWQQAPFEPQGGGTFSHPWTAAPAYVIPRFLMGVRPLQDAWRRITIRPLPPKALTSASLTILTGRGPVSLAFETDAAAARFTANLTIPGNTGAQVCLPRYLFRAAPTCSVKLGGVAVASENAGGLLCLGADLGGGIHTVVMSC